MNGDENRCNCARCRSRGLMGPAVLVTLGVLFLLTEFWHMSFQWPVLLIVIGAVKVWQSTTSREGHMQNYGSVPPAMPPVNTDPGQVHNG
jgi:LiaI-LiaF-like transmembrane region